MYESDGDSYLDICMDLVIQLNCNPDGLSCTHLKKTCMAPSQRELLLLKLGLMNISLNIGVLIKPHNYSDLCNLVHKVPSN